MPELPKFACRVEAQDYMSTVQAAAVPGMPGAYACPSRSEIILYGPDGCFVLQISFPT